MPESASSSPLRLLLVLAESAGGIGRHVATLATGLAGRGVDVTVCGPAGSLAALGDLSPARVEPAAVGRAAPAGLAALRTVRRLAGTVDVVHAHGIRAGATAVAAARGRPVVVTWHNARLAGGASRLSYELLARYTARGATLTLAASEDLASDARRAGGTAVRTTFVVAPALPPARADRAAVRSSLDAKDRPVVLAVGRLQAQKGFDVLVAAAAGWAGRGADAPLVVIAGDGPDRDKLAAEIRRTGAPVVLLGARADVADLLGAADAVALPSVWEAKSLVAQEALRAGVPLVTTAVGGLPELVGSAAITVPVGDAAALRGAIEAVLADHELHDRLVAGGLARAADWPDEPASLDQLMSIYLDLKRN